MMMVFYESSNCVPYVYFFPRERSFWSSAEAMSEDKEFKFNQSHISLGSDINDINEFLKDTPGADGAAVSCGSDRGRGDSSESVSAE